MIGCDPPLLEIAIEPRSKVDQERLAVALVRLVAEDPTFRFSTDPESGQTTIKGMTEHDLEAKLDILRRDYKVEAYIGAPQVAYLERISRPATVDYTHKKLMGSSGQFAAVKIIAEPLPPGTGFEFVNEIVGGAVPKEYIPGVEKRLESALGSGILAGFPVVDLKVTLIDGKYHDVDSSPLAFEIAARMALREALVQGDAVLFEPIMNVEVTAPQDCVAAVIRDLETRRAQVQGQSTRDHGAVITALVPLATLFGHQDVLVAIGRGRTHFVTKIQFDHYAPVPLPDDPSPFRPAAATRA